MGTRKDCSRGAGPVKEAAPQAQRQRPAEQQAIFRASIPDLITTSTSTFDDHCVKHQDDTIIHHTPEAVLLGCGEKILSVHAAYIDPHSMMRMRQEGMYSASDPGRRCWQSVYTRRSFVQCRPQQHAAAAYEVMQLVITWAAEAYSYSLRCTNAAGENVTKRRVLGWMTRVR